MTMGFFHKRPSVEQMRELRSQYPRHFQPPADAVTQKLFGEIRSAQRKEERAWAKLERHLSSLPPPKD